MNSCYSTYIAHIPHDQHNAWISRVLFHDLFGKLDTRKEDVK